MKVIKLPLPDGMTQNGKPYLLGRYLNPVAMAGRPMDYEVDPEAVKFWEREAEKYKDPYYWIRSIWDAQAKEHNKKLNKLK